MIAPVPEGATTAPRRSPSQATITSAAVEPGHDGRAELTVEVAYPSGGRVRLTLAPEAAEAAIAAAGASAVSDLIGLPWHVLVGGAHGVARLTRGE